MRVLILSLFLVGCSTTSAYQHRAAEEASDGVSTFQVDDRKCIVYQVDEKAAALWCWKHTTSKPETK